MSVAELYLQYFPEPHEGACQYFAMCSAHYNESQATEQSDANAGHSSAPEGIPHDDECELPFTKWTYFSLFSDLIFVAF